MRFYTKQHNFYCGIDLHCDAMYVCIINSVGEVVVHKNIPTRPKSLSETDQALSCRLGGRLRVHVLLVLAGRSLGKYSGDIIPISYQLGASPLFSRPVNFSRSIMNCFSPKSRPVFVFLNRYYVPRFCNMF